MPEAVREIPHILADREQPLARQPPQLHREHDDEDEAEPERGDRMTHDAEDADHPVGPGATLQRGDDSQRNADQELDGERHDRELQRGGHPGEEELERVLVIDERLAEVELEHRDEPVHVLQRYGLVEPVHMAEARDVLTGDIPLTESEQTDRVAR